MKTHILAFVFLLAMLMDSCGQKESTTQKEAELTVKNFLSNHGRYNALYFSNVDTAFRGLNDDSSYKKILTSMAQLKDLTASYSLSDSAKADSFYRIYSEYNKLKDSIVTHYHPPPLGWFIIHYYQLDGRNWTDSFIIAFDFKKIIKVTEHVEW